MSIEGGSFGFEAFKYRAVAAPQELQAIPDAQPASIAPFSENNISGTVFIGSMSADSGSELLSPPITQPDSTASSADQDKTARALQTFVDINDLSRDHLVLHDIAHGLPNTSVRDRYLSLDPKTETVTFDNRIWNIQPEFQPTWGKVSEMRGAGGSVMPVEGMIIRRELALSKAHSPENYARVTSYVEMTPDNQRLHTHPGKVIQLKDGKQIKVITQKLTADQAQKLPYSHIVASIHHESPPSAPEYPQDKRVGFEGTVKTVDALEEDENIKMAKEKGEIKQMEELQKKMTKIELAKQYPYIGFPHTILEGSIQPVQLEFDSRYELIDKGPIPEEETTAGVIINDKGEVVGRVRGKIKGRTWKYVPGDNVLEIDEYFELKKKNEKERSGDSRLLLFGQLKKDAPSGSDEVIIRRYVPVPLDYRHDDRFKYSGEYRLKQGKKAA